MRQRETGTSAPDSLQSQDTLFGLEDPADCVMRKMPELRKFCRCVMDILVDGGADRVGKV